jgi:membrane protein implicated in regulation of membrane protease activity
MKMSTFSFFAVLESSALGAVIACLGLIVALALVSFSLLLALAVSSVASFRDRPGKPGKSERRAAT